MHAFGVLGDPVRRRILELLANGEQSSGEITEVIRSEFGISQPAVSQHLRVLRESGFATVRPEGARRLYAVDSDPLRDRGVEEPAASLTAEIGIAVFRNAFERWLDGDEERDLPALVRDSLHRVSALTAGV